MTKVLSPKQAAEIIGVTGWTVRQWVLDKKLAGILVGGGRDKKRYVIEYETLRQFLGERWTEEMDARAREILGE